mgnify:CR=1 FL=1
MLSQNQRFLYPSLFVVFLLHKIGNFWTPPPLPRRHNLWTAPLHKHFIPTVRLKLRDNWAFNTDRVLILFIEIDFFLQKTQWKPQNHDWIFWRVTRQQYWFNGDQDKRITKQTEKITSYRYEYSNCFIMGACNLNEVTDNQSHYTYVV